MIFGLLVLDWMMPITIHFKCQYVRCTINIIIKTCFLGKSWLFNTQKMFFIGKKILKTSMKKLECVHFWTCQPSYVALGNYSQKHWIEVQYPSNFFLSQWIWRKLSCGASLCFSTVSSELLMECCIMKRPFFPWAHGQGYHQQFLLMFGHSVSFLRFMETQRKIKINRPKTWKSCYCTANPICELRLSIVFN